MLKRCSMTKKKILEIGPYPPPETGWSVRIKQLKAKIEDTGNRCLVLNIGSNRKIKSAHYIDVQGGFDYVVKLIWLRLQGYRFHIHGNAQAVKGPMLCLMAHVVSTLTFKRAFMTFHGGYSQLYFPRKKAGKMFWILYLNFLLSKKIICNDGEIKRRISRYGFFLNPQKIYPIPAFSTQYLSFKKEPLPENITRFIKKKSCIIVSYIAVRNGFYLETLRQYIKTAPAHLGFVITGAGKVEDENLASVYEDLVALENAGRIVLVPSLSHDQFMHLLSISNIYLRTPDSDGVSSSVLEALAGGTVVVASDNGRRPAGVVTYEADNAKDLDKKINQVLENFDYYTSAIIAPEVEDTVSEEVCVLFDEK